LPTIGRVPNHGGSQCSPISTAGPLARTVEDVALLQSVIAGPEAATPWALSEAAPDVRSGLDQGVVGLRVAWSADYGHIPVEPAILATAKLALDALAGAGARIAQIADRLPHPWGDGHVMAGVIAAAAEVGEVPFPDGIIPDTAFAEDGLRACTERAEGYFMAPGVSALQRENAQLLTPPTQAMMRLGQGKGEVPSFESLSAALDAIFENCDVLCTPTTPWVAPLIPAGWAAPGPDCHFNTNYTFIANTTQRPAASVPCGLVDGLPVGFQIIGQTGDEATVLRVARAVEKALTPLPRPSTLADELPT